MLVIPYRVLRLLFLEMIHFTNSFENIIIDIYTLIFANTILIIIHCNNKIV